MTANFHYARSGLWLLPAFLLACGDLPNGTKITDEGSGPTNTAALLPLIPGTFVAPRMVDASPRCAGCVRVVTPGDQSDYAITKAGVELIWVAGVGELERSMLEVPATVRDGMKWTSDPGPPLVPFHYTASRQDAAETPYGTRTRWRITRQAEGSPSAEDTYYAEGLGWEQGTTTPVNMIPLETQAYELEWAPELSLTEIDLPGTRLEFVVTTATAFELSPGNTLIVARGDVRCVLNGVTTRCASTECYRFDGDVLSHEAGELGVDTYAGVTCPWEQVAGQNYIDWAHASNATVVNGELVAHRNARSWVRTESDGVRAASSLVPDAGGTGISLRSLSDQPTALAGYKHPADHPFSVFSDVDSSEPDNWLGISSLQALALLRYEDGHVSPYQPLGGFAGSPGITRTEDSARLVVSFADGSVDEVVLEAGEAHRSHLGRANLPDSEWLQTSVVVGDQLLLFARTLSGAKVYRAPLPTTAERSPLVPGLGITASWDGGDLRVCWPPTGEVPELSGWTIGGEAAAGIVVLNESCALVLRQPPPTLEAWIEQIRLTIHANAEGPVPGIGQVHLLLNSSFGTGNLGPPLEMSVQPVALADGSLVDRQYAYGRGGVRDGRPSHNVVLNNIYPGRPDESGLGLWHSQLEIEDNLYRLKARLIAPGRGIDVDYGPQVSNTALTDDVVATMPGGGAIYRANKLSSAHVAVFPDGSQVPMATPAILGLTPYIGLDAPELCGIGRVTGPSPMAWICVDAAGALSWSMEFANLELNPSNLSNFVMRLTDGSLLMQGVVDGDPWMVRLDTATRTITPQVPITQLNGAKSPYGYWRDKDGQWWAVLNDSTGDHPIQFTPGGVLHYDLDQPWVKPLTTLHARFSGIYPTGDVVIIDHSTAMYRVPADRLTLRE